MKKYKATYEVDDGYAGKSRPQHFTIGEHEIDSDMDEAALKSFYKDLMDASFNNKVNPYPSNNDVERFIEWAHGIIEDIKKENDQD